MKSRKSVKPKKTVKSKKRAGPKKQPPLSHHLAISVLPGTGVISPPVYVAYPGERIPVRIYGGSARVSLSGPKEGASPILEGGRKEVIKVPKTGGVYELNVEILPTAAGDSGVPEERSSAERISSGSPIIIVRP